MGGDDRGTEDVANKVTVTQQAQEADGADVGERTRYPRRERRVPARFNDFEMGEGESEQ